MFSGSERADDTALALVLLRVHACKYSEHHNVTASYFVLLDTPERKSGEVAQ